MYRINKALGYNKGQEWEQTYRSNQQKFSCGVITMAQVSYSLFKTANPEFGIIKDLWGVVTGNNETEVAYTGYTQNCVLNIDYSYGDSITKYKGKFDHQIYTENSSKSSNAHPLCPNVNFCNNIYSLNGIYNKIAENQYGFKTASSLNESLVYFKSDTSIDNSTIEGWDDKVWANKNGYYIPKIVDPSIAESVYEEATGTFTITDLSLWENVASLINNEGDEDNKYKSSTIKIASSDNDQTIEVGGDILNKFNGTIECANNTYKFSDVRLYDNNENIGLIGTTTGCTLINVNVESVSINKSKLNSDTVTNIGILIGNIEQGATVNITYSTINPSSVSYEYDGTDAVSFGGLVGQNNGSLTIKNIKTSFDAQLYGTSIVGGIVGNNKGTINLETYSTGSIIELNSSLAACANNNVYVGGIVGSNKGTININTSVKIGSKAVTISADVLDSSKNAYAGGIVGNNESTISFGTQGSVEIGHSGGYSEISYIFAGMNVLTKDNKNVYPSKSYAGKLCGCGTNLANTDKIKSSNVINRYLYVPTQSKTSVDIGWGELSEIMDGDITVCVKDNENNNSENITIKLSNFNVYSIDGGTLSSTNIQTASVKTDSAKLYYNNEEKTINKKTTEGDYTTYEIGSQTESISYCLEQTTYNINSNADLKPQIASWILSVTKSKKEDVGGIINNASCTYKYLIELSLINRKVNDNEDYVLKITQLNDFVETSSDEGFITLNSDDNTLAIFPVIKTMYTEIENYNKKVIFEGQTGKINLFSFEISGSGTSLNEEEKTQQYVDLNLTNTNLYISFDNDKNELSIKEEYKISGTLYHMTWDNDYNKSVKAGEINTNSEFTRTLLSYTIKQNTITGIDISKNDEGKSILPTKEDSFYSASLKVDNVEKNRITPTGFTNDTMSFCGVEIPYKAWEYQVGGISYGQDVIFANYVYGDVNYVIVSCYKENIVVDYIYKNGTLVKKLSYTVNDKNVWSGINSRYVSLFPETQVSNISEGNITAGTNLEIKVVRYDTILEINVTTGNLYYTCKTTYKEYTKAITIGDGTISLAVWVDTNTSTSKTEDVYFTEANKEGFKEYLSIKEIWSTEYSQENKDTLPNELSSYKDKNWKKIVTYSNNSGKVVKYSIQDSNNTKYFLLKNGKFENVDSDTFNNATYQANEITNQEQN